MCAIENKIGTTEHSDQLKRYRKTVERAFPDYKKILIYLTPDGDKPSDDEYMAVSYQIIRTVVNQILYAYEATLGDDLAIFLRHYSEMIGGHIVSDSDVAELCRRIYSKHKRALDLIFEHKPDLGAELAEVMKSLRGAAEPTHGIEAGYTSKKWIAFTTADLRAVTERFIANGWESATDIFFEFENTDSNVAIVGYISERGLQNTREMLWQVVRSHPDIFRGQNKKLNKGATVIFSRGVLNQEDFERPNQEELAHKIEESWKSFLEDDLGPLRKLLEKFAPERVTS